MTSKVCPRCSGKSYSANDQADWNCPYCGEELRGIPSEKELRTKSEFNTECTERRTRLFVIGGRNRQNNCAQDK